MVGSCLFKQWDIVLRKSGTKYYKREYETIYCTFSFNTIVPLFL